MVAGTFTAVVDRIVDGTTAVLLLEEEEEGTVEQLDVPVERLPEKGRHEGALFEVEVTGGDLTELVYLPERERDRRERIREKFDRLSERLGEE